jgi:hypothetical protein
MKDPALFGSSKGQAMIETVFAVLFITFIFLGLFQLSRMLTAKILLDHASARAARARAVGFNDFMCRKSARVAMIPVAGKRLWPEESDYGELSRIPIYLNSPDEATARGILEYQWWNTTKLNVNSENGFAPKITASMRMHTDEFTMEGEAEIGSHYPLYMNDGGL